MKLWKKIYLLTTLITVVSIDVCIFAVFSLAYGKMLESEKRHCEEEYRMVLQSFRSDVQELERYQPLTEELFAKYIRVYQDYYIREGELFGIKGETLYGEYLPAKLKDGSYLEIETGKTTAVIQVSTLDDAHEDYRIGLRRELTGFDENWQILQPICILCSLFLSAGLALLLAAAVRNMLRPVDGLLTAAKELEEGRLTARVAVKGKDELAFLGMQFNRMAEALQQNMELLEAEAERKQQLIDNLAHEMNTPLTGIQGFAQYLQLADVGEEERQECLTFILHETNRLKHISEVLLNMAKAKREELDCKYFSVEEMAERVNRAVQYQGDQKGVAVRMNCEPLHYFGNEVLLESVLRNLVENAIQASGEGDTVRVELAAQKEEGVLRVLVQDQGCGLPKEAQERIFEPFYRVDKSRSRAHGGAGLGLAFCRTIVERHGGRIWAETEEGSGTKMWVELPMQ